MEFATIEEKVELAIACFSSNDYLLMDFDDEVLLPERPISHRLGFYLQSLFGEYHVDCEYNRYLGTIKRQNGQRVIPDIVVHKRKVNSDNLLIVEVKVKRNVDQAGRDAEVTEDIEAIMEYTNQNGQFRYKWGAFIILTPDDKDIHWFENSEPKTT
jgi:hypothetical protein